MSDRSSPVRKSPSEILDDLFAGHNEALITDAEKGKKYLLKFAERNSSLPNAVKFFLYDLLAEDAYAADDTDTCMMAVDNAAEYLTVAQEELQQRFKDYAPSIRFCERGSALALDEGEFERALALCEQAIALNLGPAYAAKRASIERMM